MKLDNLTVHQLIEHVVGDFYKSPYRNYPRGFHKYWLDHSKHYIAEIGKAKYNHLHEQLVKLRHFE